MEASEPRVDAHVPKDFLRIQMHRINERLTFRLATYGTNGIAKVRSAKVPLGREQCPAS